MQLTAATTSNVPILLLDSDGSSAYVGPVPTVTLSINGADFTPATNTPTSIGDGWYNLALTPAETKNPGYIVLIAVGTGAYSDWRDLHEVTRTHGAGNPPVWWER